MFLPISRFTTVLFFFLHIVISFVCLTMTVIQLLEQRNLAPIYCSSIGM